MMARNQRQAARTTLLWGCGGVVAVLLALCVAIELRAPQLYDVEHVTRMRLLKERLQEKPGRPLCLAVGTSRMGLALIPERLPTIRTGDGRDVLTFNFAHFGSSPAMQWMELNRIFNAGIRPEWVLLELIPGHLSLRDDNFVSHHVGARDLPVLHARVQARKLYPRYVCRQLELAPRYPTHLVGLDPGPIFTLDTLGGYLEHREQIDEQTRREKTAITRGLMYEGAANLRLSPRPVRLIRDSVRLCQAHGARVTVVLMPEGSEYRSWYTAEGLRYMDGFLGEQHRGGVEVVDARTWLDDADFYDEHHVLKQGAEKFTRRFGQEVLAPLLGQTR